MKRKLFFLPILLVASFITFVLSNPVTHALSLETAPKGISAEDQLMNSPDRYNPPVNTNTPFLGESHYYTVDFRGNGEAVTLLKAVLSNNSDTPLTRVVLKASTIKVQSAFAYQVSKVAPCMEYEPYKNNCVNTNGSTSCTYSTPMCLRYSPIDPSQYYYGPYTYKKAQAEVVGGNIEITLPDPVQPNQGGSYLLYYRAFGYTTRNIIGAYNYTFSTLAANNYVKDLSVSIQVDPDLKLKDAAKGSVDYFQPYMKDLEARAPTAVGGSFNSSSIDNVYQAVGVRGTIVKTASNLMPSDSYIVKGTYADSTVKLYAKETLIGLMVALFVITGFYFGVKKLIRVLREVNIKSTNPGRGTFVKLLVVSGVGFISAVACSVLIAIFYAIVNFMNHSSYYSWGDFGPIIAIFGILVFVSLLLLTLISPALVVGYKRGLWHGILTFVSTIAWLGVFLVVFILFSFIAYRINYRPYPVQPTIYNEGIKVID